MSAALRRALVARDGQCQFPGCTCAAVGCDAHHLRHWIDGGETTLAGTALWPFLLRYADNVRAVLAAGDMAALEAARLRDLR